MKILENCDILHCLFILLGGTDIFLGLAINKPIFIIWPYNFQTFFKKCDVNCLPYKSEM